MILSVLAASSGLWLLILLILVGVLVVSLAIYLIVTVLGRRLKPLRREFGGEIIKHFQEGTYLRFVRNEVETRVVLTSGSQGAAPHLYLKITSTPGFNLSLSRENYASLKLERWDLVQDIKVGEAEFDDRYLIRGSEPERIKELLQDPARRQTVDDLFNQGFTMIEADEEELVAGKPRYGKSDLAPDRIRSYLEALDRLAAG